MTETVLVTGGCGYIGSHTCVALLQDNYKVLVLDNLCNSSANVLERVSTISEKKITFVKGDVRDKALLEHVFAHNAIDAVVHFAGLKSVSESCAEPINYADNNIAGTLTLCAVMARYKVFRFIFSSSATVYGAPKHLPLSEESPLSVTNPYGRSKWIVEQILADIFRSDNNWKIAVLRYFNPIGAHQSGLIGENPRDTPANLLPYLTQVAVGHKKNLQIYGDDYPTPDGTCIRDYIHVMDLARGHGSALDYLQHHEGCYGIWNLGTGRGHSVLTLVHLFERVTGIKIPYRMGPRRAGDVAACYADVRKAKQELHWTAQYNLKTMLEDAWRWQSKNPCGY